MKSGLGDSAELTAAGITPVLNIPAVGKSECCGSSSHLRALTHHSATDFIDHVGVPAAWSVNTTLTDDEIDRNTTLFNQLLAEWNQSKTGRLTTTSLSHIQFSRLPNNASIFQTATDPTGGAADTPHYEQILAVSLSQLSVRNLADGFDIKEQMDDALPETCFRKLGWNDPLRPQSRL